MAPEKQCNFNVSFSSWIVLLLSGAIALGDHVDTLAPDGKIRLNKQKKRKVIFKGGKIRVDQQMETALDRKEKTL